MKFSIEKSKMGSIKRRTYILCFLGLLLCEILIGVFVHDHFVRPYIGDILITVLLCCLFRSIWPGRMRAMPVYVFLFSGFVEFLQLWGIADRLGIQNRLLRIIIGTSFDWKDILCYFCGCVLFAAAEFAANRLAFGRQEKS